VEIDEAPLGGFIVLRPVGRVDNAASGEFQERLLQTATAGVADVIVDFAAVEYISSGGLRALVLAARQKTTARRLAVVGLHALVQEIYAIAHFEQVIPIFATVEEVARAWSEPGSGDTIGGTRR